MAEIVPVSFARHGAKHLLPRASWAFVAQQQVTSLLVAEFPAAAHHFPIVFLKREAAYLPAALLGLEPGRNVLVDAQGQWRGEYIPAVLRRLPFVAVRRAPDSDEFVLCVDEESELLADGGGQPLFAGDNRPGPVLEEAQKFAAEFLRQGAAGERLCALLEELALLTPLHLKRSGGTQARVPGVSIVDERRFNDLGDEAFLKLRASGLLPAVYAHLFSLNRIGRLE